MTETTPQERVVEADATASSGCGPVIALALAVWALMAAVVWTAVSMVNAILAIAWPV